MPVTLTIPSGLRSGFCVTIPEGESVEIGRMSRLDNIFRDDQFMSRLHMRVTCKQTECVVLDLSSSNGTYVNGIRIHEALVKDGDQVRAGETCFVVSITPYLCSSSEPPSIAPGEDQRVEDLVSTRLK